jgi:cysteinyl-tRNA synthetase
MEWPSPWGVGFPGWHIECSTMSMKYLEDQLDIHCGGMDHIDVHHTNEIAQSEAATGKPFFNFWMHGAFLQIAGGKKMAKSAGNFLTLETTFVDQGLDPLIYRFACFLTHYRKPMEYSEDSVMAAKNGFLHLKNQVRQTWDAAKGRSGHITPEFRDRFLNAVNNDLNLPQAMAVVQEVLKSSVADADKLATVLNFDQVLGLDLARVAEQDALPPDVQAKVEARRLARQAKNWALSDQLRDEIQAMGYLVQDAKEGMKVIKP